MKYAKVKLENGAWVITEAGRDYRKPKKACTFAVDTETQVYFKGKIYDQKTLFKKLKGLKDEEKRKCLSNVTWAWQIYEEVNGFFMTNDFNEFVSYICRAGLKFGWVYNSTFDFAQVDYQLLAVGRGKWKPHEHGADGKGQAWTYESLHNDMGARYAYKLWAKYHHDNRHEYVHAFELRDFMKFVGGGLRALLEDLDVRDNDGNPIRKLEMDYQAIDAEHVEAIADGDIDYCCNDVKGLYFAIKQFNETIESQSGGECHIFGKDTNLMTAGGFAKWELLRSLYPQFKTKKKRIKQFQKEHPITQEQDEYVRQNHLYRGGISFVNPRYKGRLLTSKSMNGPMYRYDVNSEYPYAMSIINDLVGEPIVKTMAEYAAMPNKGEYEAIYVLTSVMGDVKKGYLGIWYDPFRKDYVDHIDEVGTHLIFEKELNEMAEWYDNFKFACDKVILIKKGCKAYKPFVEQNYALKAQAKKDKNATLQKVVKLLLNSSYGKLSERLERIKCHYELNEATGAIHIVKDEVEIDASASMNVIIGSLITATARCYILSKIREVCGNDIAGRFVYIDTDSIHAFAPYDKADAFTLGGLKLEATCNAVKYIAPKTYIDVEAVNKDGSVPFTTDGKHPNFEIHSKGVNVKAVLDSLKKKQKWKRHGLPTIRLLDEKMSYGQKYVVLQAMNVKGGKALIPTEKYIARTELAPSSLVSVNGEGEMLIEP